MTEGRVHVEHKGVAYVARWEWDDSGVVIVWTGNVGPFATITGPGQLPPESLARMMLREFLDGRDAAARKQTVIR